MDTVMARFLNDGSFEKQLKESSLIQLYALHDFFVVTGKTKEPIPASSSARLGQRVLAAHKVVERPKPKFIKNSYHVDLIIESRLARVFKIAEYEDDRDNRRSLIGSVAYDDIAELYKIVGAMQDVFTKP